jgi:alkanesulfonate monooxygenase SsuD/methylene tetrahydromethanopterin reductase-like flavin-dependent oxidoreductase (luciferase family)
MKFSLFYEIQVPRPWDEGKEHAAFKEALEQIELADKVGFDGVWEVEHHFTEEYSHSSAPEVVLSAAAARTKRIRIGHGIAQLTTNPPQRIAERVSTLDHISDGRVNLGLGESGSDLELAPFGRDKQNKRAVFEDGLKAIVPMMTEEVAEYHGPYYDFPPRCVLPKPYQKPHPPMWVACTQLDTIIYTAQLGLGALGFQFVGPEMAKAWVHAYYNNWTKHQKPIANYQTNAGIALVSMFQCAPTDEEAQRRSDGFAFFEYSVRHYANLEGPRRNGDLWGEFLQWKDDRIKSGKGLPRGATSGIIGSPKKLRERLKKYQASNIDEVMLFAQVGGNSHENIMESIELFAKEVMPEFQDDPAHDQWKAEVLGGARQLEDIPLDEYQIKRFHDFNKEMGRGERILTGTPGS